MLPSVFPSFQLSFHFSICQEIFLELYLWFFLNFAMVWETHVKLCVTEPCFPKKFFCPKNWENGPKRAKNRVFWIYWNTFVISFYWICCIKKIYIISRVPAEIPNLGKFLSLRYGPKCSQPISFLINHIFGTNQWNNESSKLYLKNELMEWTDFLHAGGNVGKQKVISMIFGWEWSKMAEAF